MGVNPVFPWDEGFEVEISLPDGRTLKINSPELKTELESRMAKTLKLRFSARSLYDCLPISVFGNATTVALEHALNMKIDRRRFRANIYVDWTGDEPFRENALVGSTLQFGDRLQVVILERDPRCRIISIDPDTARLDKRVLSEIINAHGGTAGVYAAVLVEGVARKGDPVLLV